MRRPVLVLMALACGLGSTVALASPAKTVTLNATLVGKVEVPKGSPTGKGSATITISGTKVCWKFVYSGIDKTTASHIHKAPAGKSGPVVVPFGAAFKPSGCTTTTATLAKAIVAKPSAYYVNIHTVKYPGGAIRGQL
jgi:hypothetical protein